VVETSRDGWDGTVDKNCGIHDTEKSRHNGVSASSALGSYSRLATQQAYM
jgi:hypothetical protein